MLLHYLLVTVIAFFPHVCWSWSKYEQPVELLKPNEDGVYEFELLLEPKLSMSSEHAFKALSIHEYNPKKMAWMEWDKDQLKGCDERFTLFEQADFQNSSSFNQMAEQRFSDLIQLNGRHIRLVAVNGQMPGPTIGVPLGAEVLVRVKNRLLVEGVTLHFHGLDMQDNWFNGGLAYLQQCPIAVKSDYSYRFVADRIGTHWYHGQFPRHQDNGLLGAFVVLPNDQTEEFQELRERGVHFHRDYVAILQDWPYQKSIEQQHGFNDNTLKWAYGFENDDEGVRQKMCTDYATWHGRPDPALPLTTYKVKSGENIRLRVIHGGWEQALMISIEGHRPITIIAADGTPVRPLTVDMLMIYPGERYDLLIRTLKQPARKQFCISQPVHCHMPIYGLANLEYEDVDFTEVDDVDFNQESCRQQSSKCWIFNCPFQPLPVHTQYSCLPVDQLEVDDSSKHMEMDILSKKIHLAGYEEHFLSIDPNTDMDGYIKHLPKKPGLAKGQPCECFYHKRFRLGNIVQLTVYNMGTTGGKVISGKGIPKIFRTVSMHVHGTHFYVVKMGFPSRSEDYYVTAMNPDLPCHNLLKGCLDLKWGNSSWLYGNLPGMRRRPSLRDTVIVPFGGYTVIRFRARNAGWWMLESCNTLHNDGGTKFAFAVGLEEQMPKIPPGMPLDCGGFRG
uniref:Multicopper oxidase n=1 Tax=Ditylenchus dipsaci TaxID=166011 RepID=A0A915DBR7_9BILA